MFVTFKNIEKFFNIYNIINFMIFLKLYEIDIKVMEFIKTFPEIKEYK